MFYLCALLLELCPCSDLQSQHLDDLILKSNINKAIKMIASEYFFYDSL